MFRYTGNDVKQDYKKWKDAYLKLEDSYIRLYTNGKAVAEINYKYKHVIDKIREILEEKDKCVDCKYSCCNKYSNQIWEVIKGIK